MAKQLRTTVTKETIKKQPESKPKTGFFSSTMDRDPKYDQLLFLDKKSWVFLWGVISIYILLSLMKIHSSSTPIWSTLLGNKMGKDLLWGSPKGIRQDDWLNVASTVVNNYKNNLENVNYSIGSGESILAWSALPSGFIKEICRPRQWPYYFMDVERGFSFEMNSKATSLIIGAFLVFMIITRNNFYLAIFGTFWLYLSGVSAWWNNNFSAMLGYPLISLAALLVALETESVVKRILLGYIVCCGLYGFALMVYPPLQIPMVYGITLLGIAILLTFSDLTKIRKLIVANIVTVGCIGIALISFLTYYYIILKDTLNAITSTIYPGKRVFSGGSLPFHKLFSESLIWYFEESKVPKQWPNISESSNVLMMFPVILPIIIIRLFNGKRDWLYIAFLIISIFSLSYMFVGWPAFLSKITLFEMAQDFRVLAIYGYFNVIFTIYFISNELKRGMNNWSLDLWTIIGMVSSVIFSFFVLNISNSSLEGFFTSKQIATSAIILSLMYCTLIFSRNKYSSILFSCIVLIFCSINFKVNPIVKGLKPLLDNELNRQVLSVPNRDEEAKWAVFGNYQIADLLKTAGIKLFNGTKFPPNLEEMRKFDASPKADSCYNRYAHFALNQYITPNDSVVFIVPKFENGDPINDLYYGYMDPCSPKLKNIGVKYIAFTYQPQAAEIRCMDLVSTGKIFIYQYKP